MAIDHSNMRLGKRPRRHDSRTLKLARYLTSTLPPAPSRVDYTRGVTDWGMMLNDQLGCCTIAAAAHAVQAWTVNSGQEITIPDSAVLGAYEKWCGYNPADAATDQGGIELDVLNNWRQQAFDGHGLDAYVAVDLEDRNSKLDTRNSAVLPRVSNDDFRISAVATAIWLFGGAYIGVELPLTARNQDVWDEPANPGPDDEPGSWGGHAVYLVAYDFRNSGLGPRVSGFGKEDSESPIPNSGPRTLSPGTRTPSPGTRVPNSESRIRELEPRVPSPEPPTLTCITWGQLKKMTWAWFHEYCSEAYALVSKDWLCATGEAPSGFDLATLEQDLKAVTCP